MHPTARYPRTSNSFQAGPVKSLGGLFILVVLTLALLAPMLASAGGAGEAWSLSFSTDVPTTGSITGLCDGTPLTQDGADPPGVLDRRVVTLGHAESDVSGALHRSAFLVRVSADGREVTAVCEGMHELLVLSARYTQAKSALVGQVSNAALTRNVTLSR